jgi:hypothetical protein
MVTLPVLVPGDMAAQLNRTLENLETILRQPTSRWRTWCG